MASDAKTVAFLVDQIATAGVVHAKAMFGEYGLYCDGKMVAMVCDDQLFVKPTAGGRAFAGLVDERPPYPGAKPCCSSTPTDGTIATGSPGSSASPLPSCRCPSRGRSERRRR